VHLPADRARMRRPHRHQPGGDRSHPGRPPAKARSRPATRSAQAAAASSVSSSPKRWYWRRSQRSSGSSVRTGHSSGASTPTTPARPAACLSGSIPA
jgi:hypothetical protein